MHSKLSKKLKLHPYTYLKNFTEYIDGPSNSSYFINNLFKLLYFYINYNFDSRILKILVPLCPKHDLLCQFTISIKKYCESQNSKFNLKYVLESFLIKKLPIEPIFFQFFLNYFKDFKVVRGSMTSKFTHESEPPTMHPPLSIIYVKLNSRFLAFQSK